MIGWIKLHRKLRDWEWYDDHNATRLLIHLLISVNYEDKKWKGILIKSGSLVTSWEHLSKDCGLSLQQTRTSMTKLESSGEVTRNVTNKFQLITLVKWEELQSKENQITEELTNKQQSNNKQVTTTKEEKEYKKEKQTHEQKLDWFKQQVKSTDIYQSKKHDDEMFIHFTEHWTAKKPNGTKMAYEMQDTFSFQARLRTWIKNENKYKKS